MGRTIGSVKLKLRVAIIVAGATALAASLVPAGADRVLTSENMLPNRGFERCTRCFDNAGGLPDRWGRYEVTRAGLSWTAAAARTGVAGVQLAAQRDLATGLSSEPLSITKGATYAAVVWFKAAPGSEGLNIDLHLEFIDGAGRQTDVGSTYTTLGSGWTKVTVRKTPKTAAERVRVLAIVPPDQAGAAYLDDATLKSYFVTPT